MDVDRQEITVEELLTRYTAGERDFIYVVIDDWREDLPKGIDLSGINLEGSVLNIDFSGSIVRRANLRSTIWDFWKWEGADLSGSDMTGINNTDSCVFVRCNFSNTIWSLANLFQSTFEDCNLTGANFDNASLAEVRFTR